MQVCRGARVEARKNQRRPLHLHQAGAAFRAGTEEQARNRGTVPEADPQAVRLGRLHGLRSQNREGRGYGVRGIVPGPAQRERVRRIGGRSSCPSQGRAGRHLVAFSVRDEAWEDGQIGRPHV